jgi:hypothetical protein
MPWNEYSATLLLFQWNVIKRYFLFNYYMAFTVDRTSNKQKDLELCFNQITL